MSGQETAARLLAARRFATATESGIVFKKSLRRYWVHVDDRVVVCSISSRLRKVLIYPVADPSSLHPRVQQVREINAVDPIAVGDVVCFVLAADGSGVITEVVERASALVRRAAGPKPLEHVIVANVDQIVCVIAAAQPAPTWELLDRYLVAAESSHLPALVCITKADLADPAALIVETQVYERIGYPVIVTSAATGSGIDGCREALIGRVSVLAGKSGVGKSSLLNAIQPGLGLRVNAVSAKTGKGKHTTSHLEMFALDDGGSVVDTPGMREFGLWNVPNSDLASYFREMRSYIGQCKFGANCSHIHEPQCAIKAAVEAGAIRERRYHSYERMRNDYATLKQR